MSWWQDVRYAARSLRKSPGFTLVAAVTLALGVGANTAIFSVVNAVMLRPLPFSSPGQLARIWESNVERGRPTFAVSHRNFLDWRAQSKSFQAMAATNNLGLTWTSGGEAEVLPGMGVTATFLPTLQVTPILGRNFLDEEDRPGGNTRVVILGHGFWQRAFGGDAGAIGKTMTLNAQPYTIVGVLPASFRWGGTTDILAPLAPDPERNRGDHRLSVIARLADGVSLQQATSELEAMAARMGVQYPESNKGWGVRLLSFYDWVVPESTRRSLLVLLGAVALVLLIACGNVVNLLLARGTGRQRELSIRAAMGATRARIARQLLFESCLIAVLAAGIGAAISFAAVRLLVALGPGSVPRLGEISIDGTVLAFALGVALTTMIVFGLAPAIQAARQDPQDALRADSRGSTSGTGSRRIRAALTVAEVALSVALLIGAGLLIRSFARLQQVNPGFNRGRDDGARRLAEHGVPGRAAQARLLRTPPRRSARPARHRGRGDRQRAAALGRLHGRRRQAAHAVERGGRLGGVAARGSRVFRRHGHPAARTRVHVAGRDRRPARGHHQRDAGRALLSQPGSNRPHVGHAELRRRAAHHSRRGR